MPILANIGVPMIGYYWPPAWLAFVPVVLVEAWWARRVLKVTWRQALVACFLANLVTTLVGIPLTWGVWATLELVFFGDAHGLNDPAQSLYAVTVQAAWLLPYERSLYWMIPAAAVSLTAVCYLGSVLAEGLLMAWMNRKVKFQRVLRWAWMGHLLSYAIVLGFVIAFLYIPRQSLSRISETPVRWVVDVVWNTAGRLAGRPADPL